MSYLVVLVIGIAIGVYFGARLGGRFYLRRLTESEHETRISRAGLKR